MAEESKPRSIVIYGVTDRSGDPWHVKLNDFFIDHSPVSDKEKAMLFDSLRLLVASGVRFTRALELLTERSRNLRLQRVLQTIHYDMTQRGLDFSSAMSKYPKIFREAEVKMVYSGEITGRIEAVLDSVAVQIQKNIELETRVKSALMYPATVFGAIMAAAAVVMIFVVPKFTSLFQSFGANLPFATKILIGTSDFFLSFWWLVLTFLVAGYFIFENWKSSDQGRRTWDGLLLQMPLIKTLVNNLQTVRIAGNLGTLLKSGVPVEKALQILSEIVPNAVISDAITEIALSLKAGKPLHKGFSENKVFDPILGEILEIGEQTGATSEILGKTALQYESEVSAQLKNLTTVIEPVIIFVVGGAVVFMAMAIMTPIFKLQELTSTVG